MDVQSEFFVTDSLGRLFVILMRHRFRKDGFYDVQDSVWRKLAAEKYELLRPVSRAAEKSRWNKNSQAKPHWKHVVPLSITSYLAYSRSGLSISRNRVTIFLIFLLSFQQRRHVSTTAVLEVCRRRWQLLWLRGWRWSSSQLLSRLLRCSGLSR